MIASKSTFANQGWFLISVASFACPSLCSAFFVRSYELLEYYSSDQTFGLVTNNNLRWEFKVFFDNLAEHSMLIL